MPSLPNWNTPFPPLVIFFSFFTFFAYFGPGPKYAKKVKNEKKITRHKYDPCTKCRRYYSTSYSKSPFTARSYLVKVMNGPQNSMPVCLNRSMAIPIFLL